MSSLLANLSYTKSKRRSFLVLISRLLLVIPSVSCRRESVLLLTDLPPANRASRSLVKFVFGEEDEHEEALYGTANHRVSEGSRGRYAGQGTVQEARVQ
ncbi:hypothetical protein A8F39_15045 [Burkholderia cenocepacia]|nr:hypothetical protein A8F39_15045 [Burkholderia cenocepacia]